MYNLVLFVFIRQTNVSSPLHYHIPLPRIISHSHHHYVTSDQDIYMFTALHWHWYQRFVYHYLGQLFLLEITFHKSCPLQMNTPIHFFFSPSYIYIYIYTYNLLLHVNTFSSRYATSAYIYQITTYLYHIKSILLSHHTSHMIHFHIFIMRFTPMHPAHLCNILHHAFEH